MAIVTKSPARGRASIPSAPEGTYEAIASKYAEQFREAKRLKETNELNTKIVQWQNGDLSYEDLKKFLEERIANSKDNSTQKVNLMQTLSGVERQQVKIKELDNQERVSKKRAELIEKYKDQGVSNQEQLSIIQELRGVADEDSDIFRQLVEEEAKIRGAIEAERTAGGSAAVSAGFKESVASIENGENRAEFAYQRGEITGAARDDIRLQHAQELLESVQSAIAAGSNVSEDKISQAVNFMTGAQKMVELRQQGYLVDAISDNGEIVRIDTTQNNFGREITFSPTRGLEIGDIADISSAVRSGPFGLSYYVGEEIFPSKKAAMQYAQDNNIFTFNVLLPNSDPNAQKVPITDQATGEVRMVDSTESVEITRDNESGAFYETQNPENVYAILPSTLEDREKYKIQGLPEDWTTNPDMAPQIKNMITGIRGGEDSIDLTIDIPEIDFDAQAVEDTSPSFFQKMQETFTDAFKGVDEKISQMGQPKEDRPSFGKPLDMEAMGEQFAKRALDPVKAFTEQLISGPRMGPSGVGEVPEFKMPGLNLPDFAKQDFKMPKFTMPNITLPSFGGSGGPSSPAPQVTTPGASESTGIVDRIKGFGQKAFTGFKNLFGL